MASSLLGGAVAAVAVAGAVACVATVLQAATVALRTPRLPHASGPLRGAAVPEATALTNATNQTRNAATAGTAATNTSDDGSAPPLNLLVFGDSVAAGVGCPSHEQAFAGSAAQGLAVTSGRRVEWHVVAQSGYTAGDMHANLVPRLRQLRMEGTGVAEVVNDTADGSSTGREFDVCLISVGVNHALSVHHPSTYERELRTLLTTLRQELGQACALVVLGMPPMADFPAVAKHVPLSWLVQKYADALHGAALRGCGEEAVLCTLPSLDQAFVGAGLHERPSPDKKAFALSCMASDGFHPSAAAIDLVAEELAHCCLREASARSQRRIAR